MNPALLAALVATAGSNVPGSCFNASPRSFRLLEPPPPQKTGERHAGRLAAAEAKRARRKARRLRTDGWDPAVLP